MNEGLEILSLWISRLEFIAALNLTASALSNLDFCLLWLHLQIIGSVRLCCRLVVRSERPIVLCSARGKTVCQDVSPKHQAAAADDRQCDYRCQLCLSLWGEHWKDTGNSSAQSADMSMRGTVPKQGPMQLKTVGPDVCIPDACLIIWIYTSRPIACS